MWLSPTCFFVSLALFIREKLIVNGIDCLFELGALNETGNADFRRADDVDVDTDFGQSAKHARSRAWVAKHASTDDGNLGDIFLDENCYGIELIGNAIDNFLGLSQVAGSHREYHIGNVFLDVAD